MGRVALREPMHLCTCVSEEGGEGEALCPKTPSLLSYTRRYVSFAEVDCMGRGALRESMHLCTCVIEEGGVLHFTLFPIREEKAFFFLKFLKMHMEDTLLQIFIENRVFLPALPCRLVYMRVYNICAFAFLLCCDDLSFSISLSPSPSLTARERGGSERDGGVDAEGGKNGERESGTHERSRQKECP